MSNEPTDATTAAPSGVTPTIHGRGVERLDAVVDLTRALARPRALTDLLDEVPRRVAQVFRSEVCSLYLREGDGLVMRGNVGFTTSALGEVRLGAGEGLVGMAVECLRPVSADIAPDHARFRSFSMLGEERFPAFLAVPVPGPSGAAGALVVQRKAGAYSAGDVELLMALAGAVSPLLERARIVASDAPSADKRTVGTRRVTVPGRTLVPGRALGILAAVQRPTTRPQGADAKASASDQAKALDKALRACAEALDKREKAAVERGVDATALVLTRSVLDDGRLRERTLELAKKGGLGQALSQVAREATRSARITDVPMITERAMEMSELCDALRATLALDAAPVAPKGAVWVGETVTVFDLLMVERARPAALVLSGPVAGRARSLVELIGAPAVCEAAGIFNWATDGDVALVDGDHGLVRVNPSRRERDEARVERGEP